jgi:MFS family permease
MDAGVVTMTLAFTGATSTWFAVGFGNLWIGLAAIVLFGLPHAYYNATLQGWSAEQFAAHGQGAVMGLLSTTFCLANIVMALVGGVLTLFDTRLVLVVGGLLAAWAALAMRNWSGRAVEAQMEVKVEVK